MRVLREAVFGAGHGGLAGDGVSSAGERTGGREVRPGLSPVQEESGRDFEKVKVAIWCWGKKYIGEVLRVTFEKDWRLWLQLPDGTVQDFCLTDDGDAVTDIEEIEFLG